MEIKSLEETSLVLDFVGKLLVRTLLERKLSSGKLSENTLSVETSLEIKSLVGKLLDETLEVVTLLEEKSLAEI